MATDAETIAQLQAERAELLRRIDAAESTLSAMRDAAVAEEREECARICDAEARRLAAMVTHGNYIAGIAAEKVGAVARDIRARGGAQ